MENTIKELCNDFLRHVYFNEIHVLKVCIEHNIYKQNNGKYACYVSPVTTDKNIPMITFDNDV